MDTIQIVGIVIATTLVLMLIATLSWTLFTHLKKKNASKPPKIIEQIPTSEPKQKPQTTLIQSIPKTAPIRPNSNVRKAREKFAALRFLAFLIKCIAIITALGGYALSGMALAGGGVISNLLPESDLKSLPIDVSFVGFIVGVIISTIAAILIYAYSDFIQCVIDIEQNTRQTVLNTGSMDEPT